LHSQGTKFRQEDIDLKVHTSKTKNGTTDGSIVLIQKTYTSSDDLQLERGKFRRKDYYSKYCDKGNMQDII